MSSRQDREFTEKRAALEAFLAHGPAMLHLDARHPGVRVPPWLNDDLQLRLRVSPRFDPPDLLIDEWGVRQTLSFQGRRFPVAIPWRAIYGLSDACDELRLFPRSMPFELIEAVAASQGLTSDELEKLRALDERGDVEPAVIKFSSPDAPDAAPDPSSRPKPHLVSIDLGEPDASAASPDASKQSPTAETDEDKARRRAHLRVIK